MEKLYLALRDLTPQIEVPEDVRVRAKVSLDRMLAMSAAVTDVPVKGD
jgi:quinolinate synthase